MEAHGKKIEELVGDLVEKDLRILDLGCGTGINTHKLRKKTENIVGYDIKDYRKKKYKSSFQFVLGRSGKLPFKKESFDVVVSWDVIEHVNDDLGFMKEIYRVLKPGGYALLSTPNKERLSNRIMKIFGKKISYPYCLGTDDDGKNDVGKILHIREYLPGEIAQIAKDTGFSHVKVEGVYLGFYGFIKLGLYRVPVSLYNFAQHIFLTMYK